MKLNVLLQQKALYDDKIKTFMSNYDSWIETLSNEARPVVAEMITVFEYYTQQMANKGLVYLHERLNDDYGVCDNDAVYTYIQKRDGKFNSSLPYFNNYRLCNNISEKCCCTDLDRISEEDWSRINNIVIVDDCCGSGNTIDTFLRSLLKPVTGKNIYYLVLHTNEASLVKVKRIAEEIKAEIIVIYCSIGRKAFDYDAVNQIDNSKKIIKKFSEEIKIPDKWVLGWDETEALMAFYNNTPNDTIGLFWYDTDVYRAPFPRKQEEEPSWKRPTPREMQAEKQRRKRENYNAVKERYEF